jgi:hypothetical protein
MAKNAALASNMPKLIFKSLMRFSLVSRPDLQALVLRTPNQIRENQHAFLIF